MQAHDQLSREECLMLQTLVNKVILGDRVQFAEVNVLFEL